MNWIRSDIFSNNSTGICCFYITFASQNCHLNTQKRKKKTTPWTVFDSHTFPWYILYCFLLLGWIQNRFTSLDFVKHCHVWEDRRGKPPQRKRNQSFSDDCVLMLSDWGPAFVRVCLEISSLTFPLTSDRDATLHRRAKPNQRRTSTKICVCGRRGGGLLIQPHICFWRVHSQVLNVVIDSSESLLKKKKKKERQRNQDKLQLRK